MSKTYHFIGIKGSGMSALALMLHQMGHKVQGSDVEKYYFTQRGLEQAGIPILPFDEKNITEDVELIAGNAFREDNNVEVAYAIKNGYSFKRYHEFLGHFMDQFTSFGVAGAHGKTSTTGLLSHVMKNITDTSYLIGDGTGRGSANAQYFVFESDEYERHFMPYHPAYSIITNIDFDHPDYFTSIDDVFSAFDDYAKQVQKGLFVYGEDPHLRKITANAPIYYYGFEENDDFIATDIVRTTTGSNFKVKHDGQILGEFHVPAYGRHNILMPLPSSPSSTMSFPWLIRVPPSKRRTAPAPRRSCRSTSCPPGRGRKHTPGRPCGRDGVPPDRPAAASLRPAPGSPTGRGCNTADGRSSAGCGRSW